MTGFGIYTAGVLERPRRSAPVRPPTSRFGVSANRIEGGVLAVRVSGELDAYTAGEFDRRVDDLLATAGPRGVIIDLRDVAFLGVVALEVLLDIVGWAGRVGIGCRFVGGHRAVDRALEIGGLRRLQASFDGAATALVQFPQAS